VNLGNQVEWALHCMSVLALMPKGTKLSSQSLAQFHDVPKEYLSKALQAVSRAGLVITHPGVSGGYTLARSAQEITLLEIVEAVEGRQKTFNCQEIRKNNPCLSKEEKKFSTVCQIASVMYEADEAWRKVLREKKLSHISEELQAKLSVKQIEKIEEWFLN